MSALVEAFRITVQPIGVSLIKQTTEAEARADMQSALDLVQPGEGVMMVLERQGVNGWEPVNEA